MNLDRCIGHLWKRPMICFMGLCVLEHLLEMLPSVPGVGITAMVLIVLKRAVMNVSR